MAEDGRLNRMRCRPSAREAAAKVNVARGFRALTRVYLPGGGITYGNAERVAEALGVSEVHGTKIVEL